MVMEEKDGSMHEFRERGKFLTIGCWMDGVFYVGVEVYGRVT